MDSLVPCGEPDPFFANAILAAACRKPCYQRDREYSRDGQLSEIWGDSPFLWKHC